MTNTELHRETARELIALFDGHLDHCIEQTLIELKKLNGADRDKIQKTMDQLNKRLDKELLEMLTSKLEDDYSG